MEKLDPKTDGASPDIVGQNIERLKAMFPEVVTEGKIDFDALRETLGEYVDDREERYSFNWNGKTRARRIAQTPSTGTLRPCPQDSVNWETTQNLFIEGDNLEVLKLLQKSYHRKVKMIYIDPPYNTGKDFIYPDKYQDNLQTYLRYSGQLDEEGLKLSANTEIAGRYHTNWLNMMLPRLQLARNLLRDDGVLFVSIDDHEVHNLRRLCDEVFGEENFVAQFTWRTDGNFDNQAKVKSCHEYILLYARRAANFPHPPVIDPGVAADSKLYRDEIRNTIVKNGPKNPVSDVELPAGFPADFQSGLIKARTDAWPHYRTDAHIEDSSLCEAVTISSGWSSKSLLEKFLGNGFSPIADAKGQTTTFVITKTGAIEAIKQRSATQSHVISVIGGMGGAQKATAELEDLGVCFDNYPKPVDLLKYLVSMNTGNDFCVLDFFAGSATTAHAVLLANVQDSGTRRFVLVQLPEPCATSTKAYAAGYRTIADIARDRIQRVIKGLDNEQAMLATASEGQLPSLHAETWSLDLGFKAFKLDASNIKPWDADFDNLESALFDAVENIKPDRTEADVLYELLLKYGLDLAVPIEERQIDGKTIHIIGAGALIVCLAKEISVEVVEAIASLRDELKPEVMRVVFLDAGFSDDVVKTNAVQILRQAGIDDVKSL